ncbi:Hypothetical predicted protein [Podarcis lilfordi]|uniref:Uncharacterized protein n=1 Tax=Podarcis lilfordi TaxID=74358 RepID=A0AA35LJ30_9SAUR|nr:Hypothetical predicted protein [Podarcis lilfordi]
MQIMISKQASIMSPSQFQPAPTQVESNCLLCEAARVWDWLPVNTQEIRNSLNERTYHLCTDLRLGGTVTYSLNCLLSLTPATSTNDHQSMVPLRNNHNRKRSVNETDVTLAEINVS